MPNLWWLFSKTFYLHRYAAHKMFTMSKGWERFFHLLTFICQGSSYLNPRAYAILHREHHAFSDTARDPHSPHVYPNLITMMLVTKQRYQGIQLRRIQAEARFEGDTPEWPLLDRFGRTWWSHLLFMGLYTAFYLKFAPSWHWFLLLPVHFVMGPVHWQNTESTQWATKKAKIAYTHALRPPGAALRLRPLGLPVWDSGPKFSGGMRPGSGSAARACDRTRAGADSFERPAGHCESDGR
jgi:hypothetical protein